jgi:hypothetical protein
MECDGTLLEVRAAVAESPMATIEEDIPLDTTAGCIGDAASTAGACYIVERLDFMHDRLIVSLANTEVIEAAMHLRIYAYPFKNPPSMASIVTFSGWTGDSSGNEIESFADAYHANTLPNEFGSESFVDIIGDTTGVLTDFDLISATDLIYEFTLYTYMNDIPNYGKITVGWPDDWTLDCTLTYTVSCDIGCNFDTTSCDSTNNLLELLNGYDPTLTNTMQPYVMYQVGQIIF